MTQKNHANPSQRGFNLAKPDAVAAREWFYFTRQNAQILQMFF